MTSKTTLSQVSLAMALTLIIFVIFLAICVIILAIRPPIKSQAANCPSCDIAPPVGSELKRIEKTEVDGRDGYKFQCAGWEYSEIKRPNDELDIRFDPNQKEPSPRCWISTSQNGQRITTLYLEFASEAQLNNMLLLSSTPQYYSTPRCIGPGSCIH